MSSTQTNKEEMDRLYWGRILDKMKANLYSGQSVRILFGGRTNTLYLGIRTHGPVETDYDYIHKIPMHVAKWLMDERGVQDVYGRIRQMIADIEAGHEKPLSEPEFINYQMELELE